MKTDSSTFSSIAVVASVSETSVNPPIIQRKPRKQHSTPSVAFGLSVDNTYGRQVFQGILDYLRKFPRWQIPLRDSTPYMPWHLLRRWRGDGIIGLFVNEPQIAEIKALGIPVVNLGPLESDYQPFPLVSVDDLAVGEKAAKHLLKLGFSEYLFIGDSRLAFSRRRYESFSTLVREHGAICRNHDVPLFLETWDVTKSGQYLPVLRASKYPVGIFAATDRIAYGVLEACRKTGLKVPEQVAVLGCNDDEVLCPMATPELSSIDVSSVAVGYNAAHMLDKLMGRQEEGPETLLLPPGGVQVRASSDTLVRLDPRLARAVRFIREHSDEPIYVPDVVQASRISRRALEMLFRDELGSSISREIRNVHLEKAEKLLRTSDVIISEVARLSGFTTTASLDSAFLRKHETSAFGYRQECLEEKKVEEKEKTRGVGLKLRKGRTPAIGKVRVMQ